MMAVHASNVSCSFACSHSTGENTSLRRQLGVDGVEVDGPPAGPQVQEKRRPVGHAFFLHQEQPGFLAVSDDSEE